MNINKENVVLYAGRYDKQIKPQDKLVEKEIKELLRHQRYLTKNDFIKIGIWKSPRQKKRYENNDDLAIQEVTKFSFSTKSEQVRVGVLLSLNGVSYPVASTILHFAFPDRYPILDFRALWSIGWEKPAYYNFKFWKEYCDKIRSLSEELNFDIRTIDKALWQYSKENQKNLPSTARSTDTGESRKT